MITDELKRKYPRAWKFYDKCISSETFAENIKALNDELEGEEVPDNELEDAFSYLEQQLTDL